MSQRDQVFHRTGLAVRTLGWPSDTMTSMTQARPINKKDFSVYVKSLVVPVEKMQLEFAIDFHYDQGYDPRQPDHLPRLARKSHATLTAVNRVTRTNNSVQLSAVEWAAVPSALRWVVRDSEILEWFRLEQKEHDIDTAFRPHRLPVAWARQALFAQADSTGQVRGFVLQIPRDDVLCVRRALAQRKHAIALRYPRDFTPCENAIVPRQKSVPQTAPIKLVLQVTSGLPRARSNLQRMPDFKAILQNGMEVKQDICVDLTRRVMTNLPILVHFKFPTGYDNSLTQMPLLRMDTVHDVHCCGDVKIDNTVSKRSRAYPASSIKLIVDQQTSHLVREYLQVKRRGVDIWPQQASNGQKGAVMTPEAVRLTRSTGTRIKIPHNWVRVLHTQAVSLQGAVVTLLVGIPNDGLALTQAYLRDMSCRFEQENARIQTEKRRKAEHTQMPPRRASVVHV